MKAQRVSIVMPAYNAQEHIEKVIARIPAPLWLSIAFIYILDDGSIDSTGTIADGLARKNDRIRVDHFGRNRGYGAAVKRGLALCRDDGCLFAVCLHADGQYPPEAIPGALEAMLSTSIDIMQGSRIASGTALSGGMPLYKFLANRLLTFIENRAFGLSLTDYHSGMLFYSRKALESLPFQRLSDSFDFDVEAIACARAVGLTIGEMPIPTHYGTEISHVRSIDYGLRVCNVMRKFLMGRYSKQ